MPLHERSDVELGLLDHLDLTDVAVLDGEDAGRLPHDLVAGRARDESFDEGLEVSLACEGRHSRDHLGADAALLGGLGVASLLELVVLLLREGNAEHADDVPVGRPGVDVGLDDGLLLLDEGAELVTGHVHAVEVEEAVESLDILDTKLDLAVGGGLILVEVAEGKLDNSALETLRGDLLSLSSGDDGLSALLLAEDGRCDELVPILLQEGVDSLLLRALLGLSQALVLSTAGIWNVLVRCLHQKLVLSVV